MTTDQIANAISELEPQDAAFVLIEALCRVGELGRECCELLQGQVDGLGDDARINCAEGLGWLDDVNAS